MLKKILVCAAIAATAAAAVPAQAGQYAEALGACIYKNMTPADKDLVTQWAFVTLGKTQAAKKITVIPEAKIKQVNTEAKNSLQRIIATQCGAEAAKVALHEPKDGIRNTVSVLARRMVEDEVKSRAANSLPLSLGSIDSQTLQQGAELLKGLFKK